MNDKDKKDVEEVTPVEEDLVTEAVAFEGLKGGNIGKVDVVAPEKVTRVEASPAIKASKVQSFKGVEAQRATLEPSALSSARSSSERFTFKLPASQKAGRKHTIMGSERSSKSFAYKNPASKGAGSTKSLKETAERMPRGDSNASIVSTGSEASTTSIASEASTSSISSVKTVKDRLKGMAEKIFRRAQSSRKSPPTTVMKENPLFEQAIEAKSSEKKKGGFSR